MSEATYVLPLYATEPQTSERFVDYLNKVSKRLEVIVVDDSPDDVFEANANAWPLDVRHIRPDERYAFAYRKVTNVTTGVVAASHEKVIVADDDVFYDDIAIDQMLAHLDNADLVVPQNYFDPLPWHARWDAARTLLNRAFGTDFPGTLGLRKTPYMSMGGYDGDLLFENLELIRTVAASGHRVEYAPSLYVRRDPPDVDHFWSQRVRQAYDDFALPARMALWLSLAPAAAIVIARRRPVWLGLGAVAAIATAERGRRRAGGGAYFPASASLFAPVWLAERSITSWLAVGARIFFGGVPYARTVLKKSATSPRALRARFEAGDRPVL